MNTKKTRTAPRYLSVQPPAAISSTWQTEHLVEYLDRGGRITIIAPGVSAHIGEWDTLLGHIDNMPEPLCADVNISSWTVGNTVAGTIAEYYEEQEQEQGNS